MRRLVVLSLSAVLSSSCAEPAPPSRAATPIAPVAPVAYATVLLPDVPHVRQRPDFCGEACAEMALRRIGRPLDQDDVFALSGLDPALGRGVATRELATALRQSGFEIGDVWYPVEVARAGEAIEAQLAAVVEDLGRGLPSIVCMHYDESAGAPEHFRLVVGYDAATDEVVYQEPAEDAGGYRRMRRDRFEALWPLKYEAARWTLVRFRLDPKAPSAAPPVRGAKSPAAFAQHVRALRAKAGPDFHVVVEPPFVVLGDEAPDVVKQRAATTVRWAVEHLRADFFDASPGPILDVWLFKDGGSYRGNVRRFFDETPSTPYGYYSSTHGALIMNISTGGGTLVHEIVHPFVEADFPDAPAWLNEGLGSLFEQSDEREGRIIGRTNWRLAGLQRAIRARRVPTFDALVHMSSDAFYADDSGVHYAAARYLMYDLQERGVLSQFYRGARARRAEDPSGWKALQAALGETDMAAYQKRWEAMVLRLTFP